MNAPNSIRKVGRHIVTCGGDGVPDRLDPLLTVREAAQVLRCSVALLNRWRLNGRGPKFIYVGRRVRYAQADLVDFIDHSTRRSTSDRGKDSASKTPENSE
jgi:hypothetical protein